MGATISNDVRSDVKSDQIKLKELSPTAIAGIKEVFNKNPTNTLIDKKQLMSSFQIGKRETDILFCFSRAAVIFLLFANFFPIGPWGNAEFFPEGRAQLRPGIHAYRIGHFLH